MSIPTGPKVMPLFEFFSIIRCAFSNSEVDAERGSLSRTLRNSLVILLASFGFNTSPRGAL